jgi:hypothetical protein
MLSTFQAGKEVPVNDSEKPLIYIETTIPGYLVANPSRSMVLSYHQLQTREWWGNHLSEFQPVISPEVILEISRGDPEMAARRAKALQNIPELATTESVFQIQEAFTRSRILPEKAASDILHLAFATGHGCSFLLTWNCKHINNPFMIEKLRAVAERLGFTFPIITTPSGLLGVSDQQYEYD